MEQDKMPSVITEELRNHSVDTPENQLDKEWQTLSGQGKIGPNIDKYLNELKETPKSKLIDKFLENNIYEGKYIDGKYIEATEDEKESYKLGLRRGIEAGLKLLEDEFPKRIWVDIINTCTPNASEELVHGEGFAEWNAISKIVALKIYEEAIKRNVMSEGK